MEKERENRARKRKKLKEKAKGGTEGKSMCEEERKVQKSESVEDEDRNA